MSQHESVGGFDTRLADSRVDWTPKPWCGLLQLAHLLSLLEPANRRPQHQWIDEARLLLPAKYFNGRMQNKEYEQMGL